MVIYRKFGKDETELSSLGFGAMRLPRTTDGRNNIDEDKSIEIIHRAWDLGINYIHTAPGYSDQKSDSIIGQALRSYNGDTKNIHISASVYPGDGSSSTTLKILNTSLESFGVDHVDYYQLWCIYLSDFDRWVKQSDGPFNAMKWAKKYGMIKHLGFSSHDTPERIKIMIDSGLFDFMLVQYNILDRRNESVIEYAKNKGLGVSTMGSVVGGKLNMHHQIDSDENVTNLLINKSISPNEMALRFVLANSNVDVALSGMNTIKMIEENVKIASTDSLLTEEEITQIKEIGNRFRTLADLYCTGCDYCRPCPKGINIPVIFDIMNYHRVYKMTHCAKGSYHGLLNGGYFTRSNSPTTCIECGVCEKRCPQKLPIVKQLMEAHQTLCPQKTSMLNS